MKLALSPVDTWFFRDATPFTQGASPQAGVVGVFPPYPPTVVGAIRAELARAQGWDGRGRWPPALDRVLGDGPCDLGALSFSGPIVLHAGAPMFAMPLHVVGKTEAERWCAKALLRPGPPTRCDLGTRPLPIQTRNTEGRLRASRDAWVTLAGLQRIARGELPEAAQIVLASEMWAGEPRIGIERDTVRRATGDGALYSALHTRLERSTALGVEVRGVPDGWQIPPGRLLPLGGESRLASCASWDTALAIDVPDAVADAEIALIALTPLMLGRGALRGEIDIADIGANVISACVERPLRIGGWDSTRHESRELRNALPAGSTLFCTLRDPKHFQDHIRSGLVRVGAATNSGFGLCAVGRVPREETP